MGLWIAIGIPTYLALCIGVGKFISTGMGSDQETVVDAFDAAQRAYLDAESRGDTRDMGEAYQSLKAANLAKLRAGL